MLEQHAYQRTAESRLNCNEGVEDNTSKKFHMVPATEETPRSDQRRGKLQSALHAAVGNEIPEEFPGAVHIDAE